MHAVQEKRKVNVYTLCCGRQGVFLCIKSPLKARGLLAALLKG